jgi:hypothetical protein
MNLGSVVCRLARHKITYYTANFKIARENSYVWKICNNPVGAVCRPAGHNNYKGTADFESPGYYFFFVGKTYIGAFRGVFQGGRDLFDP